MNGKLARVLGYPSPIHLLGYYAFQADIDNHIDNSDFERGSDKVMTQIKREELDSRFLKAGSGDYRKILIAMANSQLKDVRLQEVADKIGRKSSDLSSYMKTLVERELVTKVDRAIYRIQDPLLQYPRQLGRTGRRLARVNPSKARHGAHEFRE